MVQHRTRRVVRRVVHRRKRPSACGSGRQMSCGMSKYSVGRKRKVAKKPQCAIMKALFGTGTVRQRRPRGFGCGCGV